jgi:chromate transporter
MQAIGHGEERAKVVEVGLLEIFLAFFRLGCTSFGGGTGGWVYREIVQRRHWLDEKSFLPDMALSQGMPGSNGVNLAILAGRRLRGGAGAIMAPVGMLAGPFAMILILGTVYGWIAGQRIVHATLDGVAAAVVGLTFATGIGVIVRGTPEPAAIAIAGVTVFCVGVIGWPMVPVMLALAPISIGIAFIRDRR